MKRRCWTFQSTNCVFPLGINARFIAKQKKVKFKFSWVILVRSFITFCMRQRSFAIDPSNLGYRWSREQTSKERQERNLWKTTGAEKSSTYNINCILLIVRWNKTRGRDGDCASSSTILFFSFDATLAAHRSRQCQYSSSSAVTDHAAAPNTIQNQNPGKKLAKIGKNNFSPTRNLASSNVQFWV